MKTDKKIVTVVAAVICDDMKSPKKIFATQRGYGEFKGGWEFPGGKIEQGELIDTVEYNYPEFHLSMKCFLCEVVSGNLELKEHEAAKWLQKEQLYEVDWLPADVSLIEKVGKMLQD